MTWGVPDQAVSKESGVDAPQNADAASVTPPGDNQARSVGMKAAGWHYPQDIPVAIPHAPSLLSRSGR